MNRNLLQFATGLAALALATTAQAAKVDLKGQGAATTGTAKIKIEDFGKCTNPLTVTVELGAEARTFVAQDDEGNTYIGTYKQKGTDGRKLIFKLDKASEKVMKGELKSFVADCTGADKVKASLDSVKVTGRVNAGLATLKLKATVKGRGSADGESGDATYSFKTQGDLSGDE